MKTQQKLIVLYGHANCGKSDSLNKLKELLRQAGESISSVPHPNSESPETFSYKGIVVCVAPGGDSKEIVERNIRYFNEKECDVGISASRSKGGTVEAIEQYAQSMNIRVDWTQKSYENSLSRPTQKMCNQETSQLLFDKITLT